MQGWFRISAAPSTPHSTLAQSDSSPCIPSSQTPTPRKRCPLNNNENQLPGVPATPTPTPKKCRTTLAQSDSPQIPVFTAGMHLPNCEPREKLAYILPHIQHCGWTLGDFQYHLTNHTPGKVLQLWDAHADGCLQDEKEDVMYRFDVPYYQIKPVCSALALFAAQKILKRVVSKAKTAVKSENGLHASARKKSSHKPVWKAMGLTTVEGVQDLLQEHLPVAYQLLCEITGGINSNVDAKRRPGPLMSFHIVVTHALSSLLYKRSSEARLLPLLLGLLASVYSTPVDVMAYCSRVGIMPTYNTVTNSLHLMANHQALAIQEHGRDSNTTGFMVIDNIQNYLRQRDLQIGLNNQMNIGLAATYCEVSGIDPSAFNNLQAKLAVDQFPMFIKAAHLNTVFSLHWLCALVNNIPHLSHLKPVVSELFRTCAKMVCIPAGATRVYPLSSSGTCETVTTELKEATYNFLAQIGQTDGNYLDRIFLVGGDGLTFQRLLEVQQCLQLHKDNFKSLAVIEPVLAVWHMEWTSVSSLFENFWDSALSPDPSMLGHSATVIGRPPQANLKKVNYYPAVDLILQFRASDAVTPCNDIFKHFADLAASDSLPEIEELKKLAHSLHCTYTYTRAIYKALDDTTKTSQWTAAVPPEGDAGRVYEVMRMILFHFAGSTHTKYCSYLLKAVTRFELESSAELVKAILKTTVV
ncbi:hypothetical protein B0H34DRAFT_674255 [Crassisporium funariophilum]|nr:hypothetical protein B0H34DRAFT_674255 [Crassisporium funariophilum]